MTYDSAPALRAALEQRLLNQSLETGISLDRLRRRVVFERTVARLQAEAPGDWVLKGGMALEVRLRDDARLTKDVDLGLRDGVEGAEALHERLLEALTKDPFGDRFEFVVKPVERLMEDGGGHLTWRTKVTAALAGKTFGVVQLDVSPRPHELYQTQLVPLPNSLAFADIASPEIEIIDIHRHAAEKFHGMLKDFGDRDNSRVRDIVDVVMMFEHDLLDALALAPSVVQVWHERDDAAPPEVLPAMPESWSEPYRRMAAELGLAAATLPEAIDIAADLWSQMFPTEES